jgi:hypothetical protein
MSSHMQKSLICNMKLYRCFFLDYFKIGIFWDNSGFFDFFDQQNINEKI